ncbi:MAG: FAD-dependent oxidoreductase [Pseudomonadota bacterium]
MKWDVIVVGAGIAGLGVGAILTKEKGLKVLVLDRYPRPGGRLMTATDYPEPGWTVDVGLHFVELADEGESHQLNARVGRRVEWGPDSRSVKIYRDGAWLDIAKLLHLSEDDQAGFKALTGLIVGLGDEEIAAWDGRSFEEWMERHAAPGAIRDLLSAFAMIMTTIPRPVDMAAGEVLYIARQNLLKKRRFLAAGYPVGGMKALTRGLVETIEEGGGEVRSASPVEEVELRDGRAVGVVAATGRGPYPNDYNVNFTERFESRAVVCALPIYQLEGLLDFSALPSWWRRRIREIRNEVTGLVGYLLGLREPLTEEHCFYSVMETPVGRRPFQGFPASNFDPTIAPPGRQLFHTDLVVEYEEAADPILRRRFLDLLWRDLQEMFPGIEAGILWKLPYFVAGCDGLARKPGLVGRFKPELKAPGIRNLYFAGDTYQGRGLAINSAARSAMDAADLIMSEWK